MTKDELIHALESFPGNTPIQVGVYKQGEFSDLAMVQRVTTFEGGGDEVGDFDNLPSLDIDTI